jgi:hypothetical protein
MIDHSLQEQAKSIPALLERIAVALEQQNELTVCLVDNIVGVANRLEDLGGYMPSIPDSFWTMSKGRK